MRSGARITYFSLCLILHGRALNPVPLVHLLQPESPLASLLLPVCLSPSLLCLCTTEVGVEWVWQGEELVWEEVATPLSFRAVGSPKDPFFCPLSHLRTISHSSSCYVQAAMSQKLAKPSDTPLAWCETHFPVVSKPGGLKGG